MWKAKGDEGMEKIVNKAFDNSEYFLQQIKKRDNFRLVIPEVRLATRQWNTPPNQNTDGSVS